MDQVDKANQPNSERSQIVFSNNPTIYVNYKEYSGCFDYHEAMEMFVFGTNSGSIVYDSKLFHIELENSYEDQVLVDVCFTNHLGIVVSLSQSRVQVWDVFHSKLDAPQSFSPVFPVVHSGGRPTAVSAYPLEKIVYIGTEKGRILSMDIVECALKGQYSAKTFAEVSDFAQVTSIESYTEGSQSSDKENKHTLLVGLSDGVVKVLKSSSKRVVGSLKPPNGSASAVSSVCVVPGRDFPPNRAFLVTYFTQDFVAVFSASFSLLTVVTTPFPAIKAFLLSTDYEKDSLLVLLADKRLIVMESKNWTMESRESVFVGSKCIGIKKLTDSSVMSMESQSDGVSGVIERISKNRTWITGKSLTPWTVGGGKSVLSTSSVFVPKNSSNQYTFNNLLRLYGGDNVFENFLRESEGVFVSVVACSDSAAGESGNRTLSCSLEFSAYTVSRSITFCSVPVPKPSSDLEIISAVDISPMSGVDRWSLLLGYSSGKVALMECTMGPVWRAPVVLEGAFGVHIGSRIQALNRSVLDGQFCLSIDACGMCCFTQVSVPDEPAHVMAGGPDVACFLFANHGYLCMADGVVERFKLPDAATCDIWEESYRVTSEPLPLSGKFVGMFPQHKLCVRETGVIRMPFPSKNGETVSMGQISVVFQNFQNSSPIISCRVHLGKYLVLLSSAKCRVWDIGSSTWLLDRLLDDSYLSRCPLLLAPTMHVIAPGVSSTSLLFKDRMGDMHAMTEQVRLAQDHFGFVPKIEKSSVDQKKFEDKPTSVLSSKNTAVTKKSSVDPYAPTAKQLEIARAQLAQNLAHMHELEDAASAMNDQSADFLKSVSELNSSVGEGKKKSSFWNKWF